MKKQHIMLFFAIVIILIIVILKRSDFIGHNTGSSRFIVFANWAGYMDPQVIKEFEEEFRIEVKQQYYDSSEALHAKLLTGNSGYDVVIPVGFLVQKLVREDLLSPLNKENIPNLKNISKKFTSLFFDPQNIYCAPYMWSSTGIGYIKDQVTIKSWSDIFEPNKIEKYKNRFSMLDSARESLGAALIYLGYSVNTKNKDEIEKAKQVLLKQKPFLFRYDNDAYIEFLASGDEVAAHAWAGAITTAHAKNPKVDYVIPEEGGIIGIDSMVVLKSSTHKEDAEKFINFILRPQINGRIANFVKYPTANKAAKPFIAKEILDNHNLYLNDKMMKKMQWIQDLDDATNALYEKAWKEVKFSSHN